MPFLELISTASRERRIHDGQVSQEIQSVKVLKDLWQVNLGRLPDAHLAVLSFHLLNRTGEENKREKLVD